MSNVDDLKSVLREALENKGVMNDIRSKMRAELYHLLEDNIIEKPRVSQENLLLNELIREYMDFNSYKYSKSIFLKETNQPEAPLNREIIAAELHIKETQSSKQVPLLYSILWHFLNNEESESAPAFDASQPVRQRPSYEQPTSSANPPSPSMRRFPRSDSDRTAPPPPSNNKKINIYKYNETFD